MDETRRVTRLQTRLSVAGDENAASMLNRKDAAAPKARRYARVAAPAMATNVLCIQYLNLDVAATSPRRRVARAKRPACNSGSPTQISACRPLGNLTNKQAKPVVANDKGKAPASKKVRRCNIAAR